MSNTSIFTNLDYEKNGKQIGWLNLPHSPHTDAWGVVPVPAGVIKNGRGPTVLLTGGVHGDEYEGPIALGRLLRETDPAQVQGRLICIPAANLPAVQAGTRTSPLDGKNMNRTFPGDPADTPSSQISHYLESVLFPMADLYVDLHSGGSSLDLLPALIMQWAPNDSDHRNKTEAVFKAIDADLTVIMDAMGETRTSIAGAIRQGCVVVAAELGCRGAVRRAGLDLAERVLQRSLTHMGVMEFRGSETKQAAAAGRFTTIRDNDSYVFAPQPGIWEAFHELGAEVRSGEPAGCIHFVDDPGREPVVAHYKRSGLLFSRRAPGLSVRGSCVAVVVEDRA